MSQHTSQCENPIVVYRHFYTQGRVMAVTSILFSVWVFLFSTKLTQCSVTCQCRKDGVTQKLSLQLNKYESIVST